MERYAPGREVEVAFLMPKTEDDSPRSHILSEGDHEPLPRNGLPMCVFSSALAISADSLMLVSIGGTWGILGCS